MAIPFSVDHRFRYRLNTELNALDAHFKTRNVPTSQKNKLLLASWNIANLGAQARTTNDLKVIAHIMNRFDLIAVQEVNAAFGAFAKTVSYMSGFDYMMTDTAGNAERLAFVYRKNKVRPRNLFAELAFRQRQYNRTMDIPVRYTRRGKQMVEVFTNVRFRPFDRNPFMGAFQCGNVDFTLVNVHLYYGGDKTRSQADRTKYARRVREVHALSAWAAKRVKESSTTYDTDIVLLGDMNIPEMDAKKDSAYEALTLFNFEPVPHSSKVGGTNLNGTKNYDQVVFAPGDVHRRIVRQGIFDLDTALLHGLYKKLRRAHGSNKTVVSQFCDHMRAYFSDHRPIWVQLNVR